MSYVMHRVFCEVPDGLEAELETFYHVLGGFNENAAMARGVLFVPVSITPMMADKRLFQHAIDENVRACRYYVQVMGTSPAPPQRNFERDYRLAVECAADPAWPMCEVVVLAGRGALAENPGASAMRASRSNLLLEYSTMEEYSGHWCGLLTRWLDSVAPE